MKKLLKRKNSKLYEVLARIINLFYLEPLRTVGNKLLTINVIKSIIKKKGQVLQQMITNQYFLIWYTIKLELIPKILISLALYFDVFYLKEINLFYQFLWILIIPFLFNGLIWLIQKSFSKNSIILRS